MSLLAQKVPTVEAHTDSAEAFVPDQSRAERTTSYAVSDFPVPSGREEEWRFTPVDRLQALFAETAGTALRREESLPDGVTVSSLSRDEWQGSGAPKPADRAAVIATAQAESITVLDIPAEAELTEPVRLILTGEGGLSHAHTVIRVGKFARATIVLRHEGDAQYSELLSVVVGDGADVTVVTVQEWADTRPPPRPARRRRGP